MKRLLAEQRSHRDAVPGSSGRPLPPLKKSGCIAVLIADDHPVLREGLVAVINRQSDMIVVAEAQNGQQSVDLFFTQRPDVCLLDLRMPVMDGVEAVISIRENDPTARLVILTSHETREEIYRALQAGAQGYVLKESGLDEILNCVRAVAAGGVWIPPAIGAELAKRLSERQLTAREMEVLRAIAAGKSNKEIGTKLNISEGTVKVHVTHMLEKLRVTGRTEAINKAVKQGLVSLDEKDAA
jgi:two-component system, NarL family, response regulator